MRLFPPLRLLFLARCTDMALYAIGDIQGCREALDNLLEKIHFNPAQDRLWFAGDLVARGPDSLGVLRRVMSLGDSAQIVLGNHDLHLLAVHFGIRPAKPHDNTQAILDAPDRNALMHWLRQQPLCRYNAHYDAVITHAGVPPQWSVQNCLDRSREVETVLQSDDIHLFLSQMYGNDPAAWSDNLEGMTRLRVITNFLTRMRLIDPQGQMDFVFKEELSHIPEGLTPWFAIPNPALIPRTILFGHWAAIKGDTKSERIIGLDTGCVWGGCLTAYRLDDGQRIQSSYGCTAPTPRKK